MHNMIQLDVFFKAKLRYLLAFLILLYCNFSFSQQKFDPALLESPKTNGPLIANKLNTVEVQEYVKPKGNCVFLKNGFRQSTFVNEAEWTLIKDSVSVVKVDIVYSKYPLRNGVYHEIYPLLFNRIKATIAMDPGLNHEEVEWNKVWQTHCDNNTQVNSLFHGVVIWYEVDVISTDVASNDNTDPEDDKGNKIDRLNEQREEFKKEEEKFEEVDASIEYILNSPFLHDSVREKLSTKPLDQQVTYLQEYFKTIEIPEGDEARNEELSRLQYLNKVDVFLSDFPSVEPVILKVLDRHPEWRNKIVINDWTGSMYGYGAQVVEWHIMNIDSSGISTVTLFNDGDSKSTSSKKIGSTGGIYTQKTSDLEELINLFRVVMSKGGGGDGPENDIEAILEAIENQPESSEIILIADNRACVRDIELADRIKRPVRIILCGYDAKRGVNAHYVYLAEKTGGGIYTIDNDYEALNVKLGPKGTIESYDDSRLKLISPQCYSGDFKRISTQVFSLKKARRRKRRVRNLDASHNELEHLPKYVYKMYNLQDLNASNNDITEIDNKIINLHKLSRVDFSHNNLRRLPKYFYKLKYLEYVNFSHNDFDTLPEQLTPMKFLLELDLSNNNLLEFERLKAKRLTLLNLSNNSISELPSLRNLSSLKNLDLSGNVFTEFPEKLPLTKKLEHLNLSNNKLTHLPSDLTDFTQLKVLDLSGNNFSWAEEERIRKMLFYTDLRF